MEDGSTLEQTQTVLASGAKKHFGIQIISSQQQLAFEPIYFNLRVAFFTLICGG
jgi:hypothetical protein